MAEVPGLPELNVLPTKSENADSPSVNDPADTEEDDLVNHSLQLPPEIWTKIFKSINRLDTLKSARVVCKHWNRVVMQVFSKRHIVPIRICNYLDAWEYNANKSQLRRFLRDVRRSEATVSDIPHPLNRISLIFAEEFDMDYEEMDLILELQKLTFVTVESVRVSPFPPPSLGLFLPDNPINVYVGPRFLVFDEVEIFDADLVMSRVKPEIKNFVTFMQRMPTLHTVKCTLVFPNYSTIFKTTEMDSVIIDGFSQFTNLKLLQLGFRPQFKISQYPDDESRIIIDNKFATLGDGIRRALEPHNVPVVWRNCSNDARDYYQLSDCESVPSLDGIVDPGEEENPSDEGELES